MTQTGQKTATDDLNLIKLPPHSIEAEQAVLGGILLDNDVWIKVADLINENQFYRKDHRLIFRHISLLIDNNQAADAITVSESLESSGELEGVGGLSYLGLLVQNTPSSENTKRYAEIVREKSILRNLASVANQIVDSSYSPMGKAAAQLVDEAEAQIFSITEQGTKINTGFSKLEPVITEVVEKVEILYNQENPSHITGVPTGFADLDKMTAGFQEGDLVIIAGRPSMGKTALALNIAEYVAVESGLPVGIFSMEMSASQLVMRTLGSMGRFDQHKLRTGRLTVEEWGRFTDPVVKLTKAPIQIDETAALNALELRARARRLHREYKKLGLIIVDYLQLMSSPSAGENRATEISEISRALKALAKELQVPVVALSQLNRSVEQRPNKRPVMADLRESGAIEQDADVILFIYRDEVYNPDTPDAGTAEIIVAKQRNGPTGQVILTFQGEYTRFANHISDNKF